MTIPALEGEKETPMTTNRTYDPITAQCDTALGCGGDHGDCEGCGTYLECSEARSGVCDNCWQARDEMGGE